MGISADQSLYEASRIPPVVDGQVNVSLFLNGTGERGESAGTDTAPCCQFISSLVFAAPDSSYRSMEREFDQASACDVLHLKSSARRRCSQTGDNEGCDL